MIRNLLVSTDEENMFNLLDESMNRPNNAGIRRLQFAIIQRLAQLNPTNTLNRAIEMDRRDPFSDALFVPTLFAEWAQSNLDEAVETARTLSSDIKIKASEAILRERTDLSDENLRSLLRMLGDEQLAAMVITLRLIEEAAARPEELWNDLITNLQGDSAHSWNISRVAVAWIEKSGSGVLDQILESLTNSQLRVIVMRYVLGFVAESDPAYAFEYALSLGDDLYNLTLQLVVETWAVSDPQTALAAIEEVEQSTMRKQLERAVVRSWAHEKPYKILADINVLQQEHHALAIESVLSDIAWNSPKEAAKLVAELPPGKTKTNAAKNVVYTWSRGDAKATLDWILNEPTIKDIQPQLLSSVLSRLAPVDPQLALDTALAQPIAEDDTGLELLVISSLSSEDIDKALEFLPQMRKGPTKLRAFQNVERALIQDREIDRALSLLQEVADAERISVFKSIVSAWSTSDAEGLLDSMCAFPRKSSSRQQRQHSYCLTENGRGS